MANIYEAIANPDGRTFNYLMDVFLSDAQHTIKGKYQWTATDDVAAQNDANAYINNGATIDAGAYYSPPSLSGSLYKVFGGIYEVYVKDNFHYDTKSFLGVTYSSTYVHDSTTYQVLNDTGLSIAIPFKSTSQKRIDGFDLSLEAIVSHTTILYASTQTQLNALFIKVLGSGSIYIAGKDGKPIGNTYKIAHVQPTPQVVNVRGLAANVIAGDYYIVISFNKPQTSEYPYDRGSSYSAAIRINAYVQDALGDVDMQAIVYTPSIVNNILYRQAAPVVNGKQPPVASSPSYTTVKAFNLYGWRSFKATADVYRSINFTSAITDVMYYEKSSVPIGTSVTTTLYSTNDPNLLSNPSMAGWTNHGTVVDGQVVTSTDTYWRIHIHLTSNAAQDLAPFIESVTLDAGGKPTVYSKYAEYIIVDGVKIGATVPIIHKVRHSNSALDFKTGNIISGKTVVSLLADDRASDVLTYPLKTRVSVRLSEKDGDGSDILLVNGRIDNIKVNGDFVDVYISNTPAVSHKAKVPKDKYAPYDGAKTYAVGDTCYSGTNAYRAIAQTTGNAPPNATYWYDMGTVSVVKQYAAGTHLADIVWDILANEINIPDRFLNKDTFNAVKTRYPLRKLKAALTVDKQVSAQTFLADALKILECGMAGDNEIRLVPEALLSDNIDMVITTAMLDNIRLDTKIIDEVDTVLVRTDYNGTDYLSGMTVTDFALYQKHKNEPVVDTIDDRFGIAQTELQVVAENIINRNKGGRLQVTANRSMQLDYLPIGAMIRLELQAGKGVPVGIAGTYIMQVIKNQPNDNYSGDIVLREVKI